MCSARCNRILCFGSLRQPSPTFGFDSMQRALLKGTITRQVISECLSDVNGNCDLGEHSRGFYIVTRHLSPAAVFDSFQVWNRLNFLFDL